MARKIWDRCFRNSPPDTFFSQDIKTWLLDNLNVSKRSQKFVTGFAATIVTITEEVLLTHKKSAHISNHSFFVAWKTPTDGRIKLNTECTSWDNPGLCSSVAAELQAIRLDIRSFKDRKWNLSFNHTYWEGNFCSDVFSGCSLDEELVFHDQPLVEVIPTLQSNPLTTVESIKEFGVKKNNTSKVKPKVEGSGKRFRDEGKSEDEECCSSSGKENPLNDEPDGESGEDVCSLGTSASVKDAKPRVRVEKTRGHRLKMPEVLQNYPRESSHQR
ncbi:hypothetical protein F3Y22_tig00116968pilonHSYRG00106 [Hibiscus syriacus]|uniref:Uncharacterized protein n=1 Tax=Hibiscus syriacus TaxID=106335 RepID=A0A6A2WIW7_HIBSY|nr:hypothetical protein F3Y22_tig00116968pilonHSYRG00106 [Hibiscus syriacus]